ncbi:hypothetical protein VUR80DRAFT_7631 [Thermomyces stellatus]
MSFPKGRIGSCRVTKTGALPRASSSFLRRDIPIRVAPPSTATCAAFPPTSPRAIASSSALILRTSACAVLSESFIAHSNGTGASISFTRLPFSRHEDNRTRDDHTLTRSISPLYTPQTPGIRISPNDPSTPPAFTNLASEFEASEPVLPRLPKSRLH